MKVYHFSVFVRLERTHGTLFIFKGIFLQMSANDLSPHPAELGGFSKYL